MKNLMRGWLVEQTNMLGLRERADSVLFRRQHWQHKALSGSMQSLDDGVRGRMWSRPRRTNGNDATLCKSSYALPWTEDATVSNIALETAVVRSYYLLSTSRRSCPEPSVLTWKRFKTVNGFNTIFVILDYGTIICCVTPHQRIEVSLYDKSC